MKKYTISILCVTELDAVQRCVESVLHNSRDFHLILTANGPLPAPYFDAVAEQYPDIVTVVKNAKNEGFIGPNNHAFSLCETPYFVCLNDDFTVSDGWLEKLEEPFLTNPKAALSGPKGTCQSLRRNLDGYPDGPFEYLEGSCLMVKTDVVRPHGLFWTKLQQIYAEDSELSLRMRRLGYTLHQVEFPHKHTRQATTKKMQVRPQQLRNQREVAHRYKHYLKVRRFDYPIIVRRGGAIGDVMLTTPIVEALHRENPMSPIWVHTRHPEVYINNPNVAGASVEPPIALRQSSSLLINLDMSYENRTKTNIVEVYADVAGIEKTKQPWKVSLYPNEDYAYAINFQGEWCAIHIGPSWPGKTWLPERWSDVMSYLAVQCRLRIVLVGAGPAQLMPMAKDWLDLRGKTTLHQLAAVLQRCKLFVGIDSMPMHCAAAVGTPAIGLFGVSSPQYVLPNKNGVIPVVSDPHHRYTGLRHRLHGKTFIQCPSNPMDTISVEHVVAAIKSTVNPDER